MDLFGVRRAPYLARRNYFYEVRHILAWGVVAGMVEGNFAAVVVAKTFGGGELLINVAATTPVAAYMASLLWGMLCVGRPKVRLFTLCTAGATLLTGSVAFTPHNDWGGWIFVAQMAGAQFFMTGVVTVRSALWKSNYPRAVRGQVSARLQVVRAVSRLAAVAAAALLFDIDPMVYRWVYPAVALAGVVAIVWLQRIRVRGERRELERLHAAGEDDRQEGLIEPFTLTAILSPGHVFSSAIRVLKSDDRFRLYCIAQMFAGCANLTIRAVAVTVITKNLLVDMRSEYWMSAVLLEVLPMLLLLLSMGRFARYFDRVGVIRFRSIHGVCWVIAITFGLLGTVVVVYAETIGPSYVIIAVSLFALFAIMRGLCYGGGQIAWNLGHLHFARPADAEIYMGIHVSLTGLRGLVLPTFGMILWATIGWWVWLVSVVFGLAALITYRLLDRYERVQDADETAIDGALSRG